MTRAIRAWWWRLPVVWRDRLINWPAALVINCALGVLAGSGF